MISMQRWLKVGSLIVGDPNTPEELDVDYEGGTNPDGITVPGDTENYEIVLALTIANVRALAIWASGVCTIKTNSTSAPDETLSFAAGQVMLQNSSQPEGTRFITHNLTKLYVTVPGDDDIVIKFGHGTDITPS